MAKDENKKVKKDNKNGFKNFKLELKKVVWPTPKQLVNNTIAVITIVLITAVIVFGLDFVFEKANEYGVERLKSSVESKNETSSEESSIESSDEDTNSNESNSEGEESENSTEENSENNTETVEQTETTDSEEKPAENQVEE